ncbi:hypothetical protein L493_0700 [Bordetella bronchiseptica 99-R-0433]|nr:hypothetical protein L493_0700 [Bordetella bronchiseptica 99-R-0433]
MNGPRHGRLSPHGDWRLQDFMASARTCACPHWDRHTVADHERLTARTTGPRMPALSSPPGPAS